MVKNKSRKNKQQRLKKKTLRKKMSKHKIIIKNKVLSRKNLFSKKIIKRKLNKSYIIDQHGGFWTTCDSCIRRKKCIGRSCINDCGYCTIQSFELGPEIKQIFRQHSYGGGMSDKLFKAYVDKWLHNKGYENLQLIGKDIINRKVIGPYPSELKKWLLNNAGENEFIPISFQWGVETDGHWTVMGKINGNAVIVESQQFSKYSREDFEKFARENYINTNATINKRDEKMMGRAKANIYRWYEKSQNFLVEDENGNLDFDTKYFTGKNIPYLKYFTIVPRGIYSGNEHKIIKNIDGTIEIRTRFSNGRGSITLGKTVKQGRLYELVDNDTNKVEIKKISKSNRKTQFPNTSLNSLSTLLVACENGNLKKVKTLLKENYVNVNQENEDGITALSTACQNGHLSVVEYLLTRSEIKINQVDNTGTTPLGKACLWGYDDIVYLLLQREEIEINQSDKEGFTPLFAACEHGYVDIVQLLLTKKKIKINQSNNKSVTPLFMACQKNRMNVINALLARKEIKINQTTNDGATPLYIASYNGHVKVVNALLARKDIQINQAANDGATPLYIACQNGDTKIVKILLAVDGIQVNQANDNQVTPLYIACQYGNLETVRILLAKKEIKINLSDIKNVTPINIACYSGHTEIVKLLLTQSNIDINKKDEWGDTPESSANKESHNIIVSILQKFIRSSTRYRGVYKHWNVQNVLWFIVKISIGSTQKSVGMFRKTLDAARAFDMAVLRYNQPKEWLNFPEQVFPSKKTKNMAKKLNKSRRKN